MALFGFVIYYKAGGEEFVISLAETEAAARAQVAEEFRMFAVKAIAPLHIEDTLGDYFNGVARCSNPQGWRFSEIQAGGYAMPRCDGCSGTSA